MAVSDILYLKLKDLKIDENLKKAYVILKKTPSPFNRDLNEIPKIRKVIEYYLSIHPELGEYPIQILPNFPNAYFDFKKGSFALGIFNASILAHEIEHSLSLMGAKFYKNLLENSKAISNLSGKFVYPIGVGQALKIHNPDTEEGVNVLYNILSASHGLASLPILYEEGKANVNAIRHSQSKWDSIKTLLPAYVTYLASATVPISFYQFARIHGNT